MLSGTPSPSLSTGPGGGGGGAGAGTCTSTILGGGGGGGGGTGAPNSICTPTPRIRSEGSFGPYRPGLAHSRRYLASVRSCTRVDPVWSPSPVNKPTPASARYVWKVRGDFVRVSSISPPPA